MCKLHAILYVEAASVQMFYIVFTAAEVPTEPGQRVATVGCVGCTGASRGLTANDGEKGEMIRLTTADINLGLNHIRNQVNIQQDVVGARPTSCM